MSRSQGASGQTRVGEWVRACGLLPALFPGVGYWVDASALLLLPTNCRVGPRAPGLCAASASLRRPSVHPHGTGSLSRFQEKLAQSLAVHLGISISLKILGAYAK